MNKWHIVRKDEMAKVVRSYRHASKMFQFVLRNSAMFKDKILTIYRGGKAVTDISWEEIKRMKNFKEGDVRTELIRKVHEKNMYKYRGPIR